MSKEAFAPAKEKVEVKAPEKLDQDRSGWAIDQDAELKYEPGVGIRFGKLLKPKVKTKDVVGSKPAQKQESQESEVPEPIKEEEIQYPEPKAENFNDRSLEERYQNGDQVMMEGKPYTVERYDGHTGDIILKDSVGDFWSESQEKVYAQNPVIGEKYYDTEFGPVSKTELEVSKAAKKVRKKEVSTKETEKSKEAKEKIKELKENIAKLSQEEQEKLRKTSGVINKMGVERDYEKQKSELKKGVRKNQKVKAKSFFSRLFNFFR